MKKVKFTQQKATRFENDQNTIGDSQNTYHYGYGSADVLGGHNKEMFPMVRKAELINKIDSLVNKDFGVAADTFAPTMNMGDRKPTKFFKKAHQPLPPEPGLVFDESKHRWVNPETIGMQHADIGLSSKLKETRESLDFIATNAHRFSSFAPTQKVEFANKLFDAWKVLGSLGRQMSEEVMAKKKEIGIPMSTGDDPSNPINRARGHLKATLQAIKENRPSWVAHELSTFSSDYHEALKKYEEGSRKIIQKSIPEISEEAEPHKPKTKLQQKVLGKLDYWERKQLEDKVNIIIKDIEANLQTEQKVDTFIKGYEKLALLSKQMSNDDVGILFELAKEVNIIKSFNFSQPQEIDRLEEVIWIDQIAHELHKNKFPDGHSIYSRLDDLADISKSLGETDRDSRLLVLDNPAKNIKKLEDLSKMDILYKGKLLEKSFSLWSLFEKAIKFGVGKLSNDEIVSLREWLYAKI